MSRKFTRSSKLKQHKLCEGSAQIEPNYPDSSSAYADEGSAAHLLGRVCLEDGTDPADLIGHTFEKFPDYPVDREMADAVDTYVEICRPLLDESELNGIEAEVQIGAIDNSGEIDFWAVIGKTLYVVDYKHGAGVFVSVVGNEQTRSYASGLLAEVELYAEVEDVELCICQPRMNNISREVISADELRSWAVETRGWVDRCVETIEAGGQLPFNPGIEQCQFCKAKDDCAARTNWIVEEAFGGLTFEELDLSIDKPIAPNSLSQADLARCIEIADAVSGWAGDIKKRAMSDALAGKEVPGYKLVEGRSSRDWTDVEKAIRKLRRMGLKSDDLYTRKALSVSQAEKKVGSKNAKKLADVVVRYAGKPTLVPESDKRKALDPVGDAFADIESES